MKTIKLNAVLKQANRFNPVAIIRRRQAERQAVIAELQEQVADLENLVGQLIKHQVTEDDLEDAIGKHDFEDEMQNAIESFDFTQIVENIIDEYDFSEIIAECNDKSDLESAVKTCLQELVANL